MAQVLCVVLGYSFKFQFQTLIAQVNLQLEVKILNLGTTIYGYLGLNSMEKDFSMVVLFRIKPKVFYIHIILLSFGLTIFIWYYNRLICT
jgi:hypothetical protein